MKPVTQLWGHASTIEQPSLGKREKHLGLRGAHKPILVSPPGTLRIVGMSQSLVRNRVRAVRKVVTGPGDPGEATRTHRAHSSLLHVSIVYG